MRFLFLAILLLAGPSTALAQDSNAERSYASVWIVQPEPAGIGRRTVHSGEFVFRQRLLPPTLARLDSDVREAGSGALIAAAGSQVFGLMTRGPPIYCVAGRRSASALMQELIGGHANRQICLVDMDRDGRFDGHFAKGNMIRNVPSIEGRRPRRLDPVTGGTYTSIPPGEMVATHYVGLKYMGRMLIYNYPYFQIAWGDEQASQELPTQIQAIRDSNPPVVAVRGANVLIEAVRPGEIDVDVRSVMPVGPFFVHFSVRRF